MGDNAGWARGMPWRFMGFGAAFIGALLAWHSQRAIPQAMAGQMMLGADTQLGAGDTVVEEEIQLSVTQQAPRRARTQAADPGTDVTVVVNTESTTIEEESFGVVVPAQQPHRLVVLVQQQTPRAIPPRQQDRKMRMRSSGTRFPQTVPRRPGGPLTPRSVRMPRRSSQRTSTPRRTSTRQRTSTPARAGSGRTGRSTVPRKQPRRRPRLR
jgi:hypothetical protein